MFWEARVASVAVLDEGGYEIVRHDTTRREHEVTVETSADRITGYLTKWLAEPDGVVLIGMDDNEHVVRVALTGARTFQVPRREEGRPPARAPGPFVLVVCSTGVGSEPSASEGLRR